MRTQTIQRTNLGEHSQFIFTQRRNAAREIVDAGERPPGDDLLGGFLSQSANVVEPQADAVILYRAGPLRAHHIHGKEMQSVALGVFYQRRGMIEPHRLLVEDRRGERGQVVALEVSAGISDQREAGGVSLRKSVERE